MTASLTVVVADMVTDGWRVHNELVVAAGAEGQTRSVLVGSVETGGNHESGQMDGDSEVAYRLGSGCARVFVIALFSSLPPESE